MTASAEQAQHAGGVFDRMRFFEDVAGGGDGGVGGENVVFRTGLGGGGFVAGQTQDVAGWVFSIEGDLLDIGGPDVEGKTGI